MLARVFAALTARSWRHSGSLSLPRYSGMASLPRTMPLVLLAATAAGHPVSYLMVKLLRAEKVDLRLPGLPRPHNEGTKISPRNPGMGPDSVSWLAVSPL